MVAPAEDRRSQAAILDFGIPNAGDRIRLWAVSGSNASLTELPLYVTLIVFWIDRRLLERGRWPGMGDDD
jgi:hypothetical protein